MGKITGASQNNFKSAEFIYSKIKREFKSFGSANLLDDADFPLYTAEILKQLGESALKESEALLFLKNGKAKLPRDFSTLYAAYKCKCDSITTQPTAHVQENPIIFNITTYDLLTPCETKCTIECDPEPSSLSKIVIKQYVEEGILTYKFVNPCLLRISPNVKEHCADNCLSLIASCYDEITINNGYIYTNFKDQDIYMKYYAFPFDEGGLPMVPDDIRVEKAIEWYIKFQLLLNFWLVDDVRDIQAKWGKAEQEYEKAMANARYIGRLPAWSTLVNEVRNQRSNNLVTFFSQQDRRY